MILIKRKPRYYSGAVLGYIDNVNVEIWEDEQWKGGMNTSHEEAAITADGAVCFIKRVRYKWYHRKKIEIHNEQNEQIGE